MDEAKLDYLIELQKVNIQLGVENNLLLKNIIGMLSDPANDAKDVVKDILGNVIVYDVAQRRKENGI